MDMVFKNDVKVEKKTGAKEDEVRKTRKIRRVGNLYAGVLGNLPICPILSSIRTSNKHNGFAPEGTIRCG